MGIPFSWIRVRVSCADPPIQLGYQAVAMQAGDFTGAINVYTEVHWIPFYDARFGFDMLETKIHHNLTQKQKEEQTPKVMTGTSAERAGIVITSFFFMFVFHQGYRHGNKCVFIYLGSTLDGVHHCFSFFSCAVTVECVALANSITEVNM